MVQMANQETQHLSAENEKLKMGVDLMLKDKS